MSFRTTWSNYGQMPLKRFAEICHAKGVPVIVDAASEYDLKGFLADGADLVIYSSHTSSSEGRPAASSPAARIWFVPPICRISASPAA